MIKKKGFIVILILLLSGLILASDQDILTAVQKGQLEMVVAMIEKQPELLNVGAGEGPTPLHLSVHYGFPKITDYLIKKGSDVNATDEYKMTPLHYAFHKKDLNTAEKLLKHGAEINCTNVWGMTPLYRAAGSGYLEGVRFLVERKADMNRQNEYGKSPLISSIIGGYGDIVKFLLHHGARTDIGDKWNQTPLFFAVSRKAVDLVDLLIKKGADIHHRNGWKQTALHQAVIAGYPDIALMLMENGAGLNDKDSQNMSPLDYAGKYGHKKLADLLKSKGAKSLSQNTNFDYFPFNKVALKNGEAVVWYLGHSGWAIKTKSHLLVFDYWQNTPLPDEPKLANGRINPEEIKNLQVVVFSSHVHHDHYDKCTLDWKKQLGDNIHYVFGWKALEDPAHTYMGFRKKIKLENVSIESVHSPEAGELEGNFLVRVDGVTIYHSGDYSRGHDTFKKDMDYLAGIAPKIDLFFMLAGNEMDNNEAFLALEKVKPLNMFPMHAGGSEYVFLEFVETALKKGINTKVICSTNRGDMFLYKNSRIQRLDSYKQFIENLKTL